MDIRRIAALGMALASPLAALATEAGGSNYPAPENYLVGAAPPPGHYMLVYANAVTASKFIDNDGNTAPIPGFRVNAYAVSLRYARMTDIQLLGGNLGIHAIAPLVDLEVSIAGVSQRKRGLGDITIGPGIAFHHSPHLHSVLALDIVAPTGGYNKADQANIGHHHWSLQPIYTMSYVNDKGFNADFKATINKNLRNSDTDYTSGTEAWVDFSAGWGVGHGFAVGVGGYWTRQLTSDKQGGVKVANNRASGFAIGPSMIYDNGKGWFITAKFQRDFEARNRVEGNAIWVKTTVPF